MKTDRLTQIGKNNLYVNRNYGTIVVNSSNRSVPKSYILKEDIGSERKQNIKFKCFLNRQKELCFDIFVKKIKFRIFTHYKVASAHWQKGKLLYENPFYLSLVSLNDYLEEKYLLLKDENNSKIIECLKSDIEEMMQEGGIVGIARYLFNYNNTKYGIPTYDKFIEAFEKHKNIETGEYEVRTVGSVIHFIYDGFEYIVSTYESKIHELKSIIEGRYYDEIFVLTEEIIWSEIYMDIGIK